MRRLLVLVLALPVLAHAAAPQEPAPVLSFGSVLQMFFGLLLVLGMVAGGAWMLRKLSQTPRQSAGAIRILASAAVGQRERVVLVEIGGTWLALGVAPGRVNALHKMPASEIPGTPEQTTAGLRAPFSEWLRQMRRRETAGGGVR